MELELCPVCKKGDLRSTGKVSIGGRASSRDTGSMGEYVCDAKECGHRQKRAILTEHVDVGGGRASTSVKSKKKKKKTKCK